MKLLLDTCTFIWAVSRTEKLSVSARDFIQDPDNICYLSSVSTWEISVLVSLGRLQFPEPVEKYVPRMRRGQRIQPLRLLESATLLASKPPTHHRDPFDHMLICQAICHGLTPLTPDEQIAKYAVSVNW